MQALRDGMGALEAALTAMAPTMATKDDMVALKTAMETGFDKMSKRLDDMEEKEPPARMESGSRRSG